MLGYRESVQFGDDVSDGRRNIETQSGLASKAPGGVEIILRMVVNLMASGIPDLDAKRWPSARETAGNGRVNA
ncbi:hypothetical protein [Streptomyces sp. NRRL S-1824]|uniref:hypothetical protein n=1 Tax=Streptomyces sp. NRRL S-1824 TaxID=1463889 RepID=UPI000AC15775|nr:hypothetical protein [Streptomyces sp. NRRL S-1824]